MIAKLRDILRGRDGEWILSLSTPADPRGLFDELHDELVDVTIQKHRNRRSLDANGFAWVLIDKIAAKMHLSKIEVYRNEIREIGGVSDTVCVQNKAVDRLVSGWQKNGLGWQAEVVPSKLEGCSNVILYYGSSVYDTLQMHTLITNLIQTAESLGIPTMLDDEEKTIVNELRKGAEDAQKAKSAGESPAVPA